jgi:hypothetical protein
MNWEAIGALGEMVGAAAVVMTLLYLASQIRHAKEATQAASFQAASALDQEFLLVLGQDSTTARIWATYMFGDMESLSENERQQAFFLAGSMFRRLENVHQQRRLGTITDEAWESRQGMFAATARSAAYRAYLASPTAGWMGGDFIDYMNQLASEQ